MDSHWAKIGDTVTLRYVEEFEFYDPFTGEVLDPENIPDDQPYRTRAVKYRDIDYTVTALVDVPYPLSYRYYGSDEFILNDQTFIQDSGTSSIMLYAFDMQDEAAVQNMETFLADATQNELSSYDFESKATYAAEFEDFRNMFLMLGGVLSFIVGLVGVLNFFNAVLTGIICRMLWIKKTARSPARDWAVCFWRKRKRTSFRMSVVRRKGFEPPTFWFVAKHSIQLSYRRISQCRLSTACI